MLLQETKKKQLDWHWINAQALISPLFVRSGNNEKREIAEMPGVFQYSPDNLTREIEALLRLGISSVLVFGIPDEKDAHGSSAYADNNVVARSVKIIKERFNDMTVMTDVCLCAYTSHGHCGVIENGTETIEHETTLRALARMALSHAEAGADWVAPSAMAERQVSAIRQAFNEQHINNTRILGYSAKYASNFYGPFRAAADSSPQFGDRQAYQLDYTESDSALAEVAQDIDEGADMVMVKPALSYLDVIRRVKEWFVYPLAAYNVSGEYAMVKHGARLGLWQEERMVHEIIHSITRAGADCIISYHAKDIISWQQQSER